MFLSHLVLVRGCPRPRVLTVVFEEIMSQFVNIAPYGIRKE